jgi:hypothetical protein
MWIMLQNSFLSIVSDRYSTENLLVRGRIEGHIEAVFPEASVFTDDSADYRYRTVLPRGRVAAAIAKSLETIDYDNFKESVTSQPLHMAYFRVWMQMKLLQDRSSWDAAQLA